ncbi:hypothetical protein E1A91_A11G012200v1 [Gossypium mustelinum]|uniref:BAHD acyltransferase DCR n=1 Tax=Gossypium mustelinum TaxID=34275 RepID=A0A5D2X0N9_GOSMU|nr:hypothetical protein E1A91_A11G012200v1 [Gossypium mustelinum]
MAGVEAGKEEEATAVRITGKSHVKPGKLIGRKECQLVTFDLPYLAFYYNQKLLFYKNDGGGEFEDKVEKLKEGLRVVLEEFYQLGGKLGKDDDGVLRVDYDDDMDGVEVVEAVAEGITGLHRPLLSIQLTKLKDGVAMGCAFNHAVLDGTSTWHFMSSWAQICNGTSSSVVVPPFLDRTTARNTRVKLDLSPVVSCNGDDATKQGQPAPQMREKLFRFSEAAVDKIKSRVNSTPPPSDGSKPFSTFQSLAVHIWRHVSQARNLKPEDYTVFTVFADCRKRVDPPMPDSYFGNLIQAIFTATAAGLLLENPPSFGASVIQKAIESHDAKAIDERNKAWEAAPKIFQFKDAGVNCVAVGSSPRFKVYEVDFGWGKPVGVRSGSNNRFDGMVYLSQGKSGGRSIDVEITMEAQAMEKLEKDKEFLMEV